MNLVINSLQFWKSDTDLNLETILIENMIKSMFISVCLFAHYESLSPTMNAITSLAYDIP